ncbi:NAD-dependent epimerase [Terribacillus sp. 179-K 1B1 HS]|uniref:NAD-dependent epimerase n=1 Tax=Terribacillus sp. 179-K 1B1 HS TaxID=3142388 RepID=UPI0039A216C9
MAILVTGSAGFIGMHVSKRLLDNGEKVIGIDNLNNYYEVSLKEARNNELMEYNNYTFYNIDLKDSKEVENCFKQENIEVVINLAAQAGVRYSLENPTAYIDSNIKGFLSILEACKDHSIKHLIYASSSSVYGANTKIPFSTNDNVDHPVSLYAATKKSNELMAHTYSHLYNLPTTGLRFFTVYGPYGRPDMAYYSFTKKIINHDTIKIFNNGEMMRDFTYIDDIVEGIVGLIDKVPQKMSYDNESSLSPNISYAPYRIYNIGNNKPTKLMDFIKELELVLGIEAKKDFLPMQLGDVKQTYADIDDLTKITGFYPRTSLKEGLSQFTKWYRDYYDIQKGRDL